jgi:hypothetical protein
MHEIINLPVMVVIKSKEIEASKVFTRYQCGLKSKGIKYATARSEIRG